MMAVNLWQGWCGVVYCFFRFTCWLWLSGKGCVCCVLVCGYLTDGCVADIMPCGWLPSGNLVMYSYRLRMGRGHEAGPCHGGPGSFFGSMLDGFLNKVRLHTEVTFWEFDQVLTGN